MSEKIKSNPIEREAPSEEELKQINHETRERIADKLRNSPEKANTGKEQEKALHEALEQAAAQHERENQAVTPEQPPVDEPIKGLSKKDLDIKFKQTLEHIQKDMSPVSRSFSKVIHNPVVDKTSEIIGKTVARPNLILAGGIGTLTLGLAVYLVAKHYGYVLSGFESIGSFIVGWAIGAIIEFIRVGFKNKHSRDY